jgi:RHS repeat-associated protein
VIGYDVRVAEHPLNPYWYGTTEIFLEAPSVGIYNEFVGHAELTPLPVGHFQRVEFTVPAALRTKLGGNYNDLKLRIAVNVSNGEPASYRVDRFTFGPASQCSPQPDGNPCTDDICDNGVPAWPLRPGGASCDTNTTVCDGVGTCSAAGVCEIGPAPSIDDGNSCTSDACDPVNGVVHLPVATGVSCETDGDACNGVSRCDGAGACATGTAPTSDDNNPCTVDSCDPETGVQHTPRPAGSSCDADANVCNGDAQCNASAACVAGVPPVVDDGNPCTTDTCNPSSGVAHQPVANGTACTDGSACTTGDSCQAGACVAGAAIVCTALDQCHDAGTCNPQTGACSTVAKPDGAVCNDGNACTLTDVCASGACTGTTSVVCAAQDACHVAGSCNPATGMCSNPLAPSGTACDDSTVCNGRELCHSGDCIASTAPLLDDTNPCTVDACDPMIGVTHTAVTEGTSCADGNACNGAELCGATGACQPGTPVNTDSGNDCTVGVCDPATGVVTFVPGEAGAPCFADLCSQGACTAAGECLPTGESGLDDGDPCTLEWCDPEQGLQVRTCAELDPTIATTLFDGTQWLYSGTDPVQQGVAPGTIVAERAAMLQGNALNREGHPLSGARVSVLDHPELGWTLTRADGEFDLVVNGGGYLVIEYVKEGYLGVQRGVDAHWGQYAQLPPVTLITSDPIVTTVNLTSTAEMQVAVGSEQTDDSGSRQGTLLIPGGTQATMHLADGTEVPLDTMSVRITEFTVGDTGPQAMPGPLPYQSHYTYAFEVNADEAIEQGAPEVTFSQPLVYYVENFLDFPAGTAVPLGSYDRQVGIWKADQSGIVLKIVGVAAGVATVDVTGDGLADTNLAALGITPAEQQKLAELYAPGQSLWRVRLNHFTSPWDCNWAIDPPDDAVPPEPDPKGPEPCNDKCCGSKGGPPDAVNHASTIGCCEQVLGETIPVAGTDLSLHYASNRVKGRRNDYRIEVPIAGATLPASLKRIDLEVSIAGRTIKNSYTPTPGQKLAFEWDGLDKWGREMHGSQAYSIKIDYAYDGVYGRTSQFGGVSDGMTLTGDEARGELYLGRTWQLSVGTYHATDAGFGAWTLSAHHAYEPVARRINYGTGSRRDDVALPPVVKVIGGGGGATPVDGGPALGASLVHMIVVDRQGRTYTTNSAANQVFRINRNGTLSLIAPGEAWGKPAVGVIESLDIGADDSIYVLDGGRRVVKRIYPDGTVATVAGNGTSAYAGDGGLATLAGLGAAREIAVSKTGDLYISAGDPSSVRLRRVFPDGTIRTVAGNGCGGATAPNPSGRRALDTCLALGPIATGPKGDIYAKARFRENDSTHVNIIRLTATGTIETVAGTNTACGLSCGKTEAEDPLEMRLDSASGAQQGHIAVDDQGIVYVVDPGTPAVVRAIEVGKRVRTVVGTFAGTGLLLADGMPATRLANTPHDVFPGPDGLYLSGVGSFQDSSIVRVAVPLPGDRATSFLVGTRGGDLFETFDAAGRHLTTRHGLTGANLFGFSYGSSGLLERITDVAGLQTQIERDPAGRATAIVAPFGQRTELEIGTDGYLASVTNPEGDQVSMSYSPGGLLTSFTDARGNQSVMTYDAAGRLESDQDASGGRHELTFNETADTTLVTRTTALNRSTTYGAQRLSSGEVISTTTLPDGTFHTSRTNRDRVHKSTLPNGTLLTESEMPDQGLGLSWPLVSRTTTLPSGLSSVETETRSYSNLDPTNFLNFTSRTDTLTVNGSAFTTTYVPATRTFTTVSPQGRRYFRTIDALGRTIQTRIDGLPAVDFVYNAQGRLQARQQAGRTTTNTFVASGPSAGYLETITDALGIPTSYTKDSLGRPLSVTREGIVTLFSWDPNGNLTGVTPPEQPQHQILYTPVNLLDAYVAPVAALPSSQTDYTYDLDRALSLEARPDGRNLDYAYDAAGRLDLLSISGGMIDYQYYPPGSTAGGAAPGQLSALLGPYGTNVAYQYDGELVTRATWSGDVSGSVAFAFNNAFKPTGFTVNGISGPRSVALGYDLDRLLICASPTTCAPAGADALKITRRIDNGLPSRIDLGDLSEDITYTTFGELATQVGAIASAPLARFTYDEASATRDALTRIVQKTEVVQGTTKVWRYGYDARSRLVDVFLDGALREHFDYDLNGNRTGYASAATGTISGTYDDQDRLLTYGTWHFTYGANGELESKTNAATGEVWLLQYDALGNLLAVTLPNGDIVQYLVDGEGRRVGRKLNGLVTNRWLYQDGLSPVAELDASGALVAVYVYGTKSHAPELVLRGGQGYRVLSDQLGSPRLVVNATSSSDVPYSASYEAFGEVTGTGLSWMPFGFAGGMYDPATRLVRFGARDYDPLIGRWVSKDPVRFEGGVNLYEYATSDPINLVDVTGAGPVDIVKCLANGYSFSECVDFERKLLCRNLGIFCDDDQPDPSQGPIFPQGPRFPEGCNEPPECKDEWAAARRKCAQLLTEKRTRQNRRLRGGHNNVEDCARGYVSAKCGGNPFE